jgi:hypothetical protein
MFVAAAFPFFPPFRHALGAASSVMVVCVHHSRNQYTGACGCQTHTAVLFVLLAFFLFVVFAQNASKKREKTQKNRKNRKKATKTEKSTAEANNATATAAASNSSSSQQQQHISAGATDSIILVRAYTAAPAPSTHSSRSSVVKWDPHRYSATVSTTTQARRASKRNPTHTQTNNEQREQAKPPSTGQTPRQHGIC